MEQCSFCGKTIDDVKRLIRSPIRKTTYICDACANLVVSIVSENDGKGKKEEGEEGENKVCPPKWIEESMVGETGKRTRKLRNMKPAEKCRKLDQHIVGQEKAKKVLSVAISNHIKRLQDMSGLIKKSNILMVGPSGTGKTLLANTIANILNVPFAVLDATSISPTGFVGNSAEICLQKLLVMAKGDVQVAQRGVIFIDEIDKLARMDETINHSSGGMGINVQSELLKLIEGCEVTLPAIVKTWGAASTLVTMDTKNILFICGGAFSGLDTTNKQGNPIGFHSSVGPNEEKSSAITHEAIIKYGLMQELVGRLPILITLDDLKEDDLVRILTEPEDSIVKEYQMLFKRDGINLHFEDDALHEIARLALANKTGARGLRTILEDVLMDIMFNIPAMENIAECIITKDTLTTKNPVLLRTQQTSEQLCLNNS